MRETCTGFVCVSQEENKKPGDFSFQAVILDALEKKGEISLKRLRKKVLAEYVACGKFMKSEEQVWRKLDKNLHNMDNVVLASDRVTLKRDS